ncbi:protein of unknown function (plasmid) [Pararobbsia alpina]
MNDTQIKLAHRDTCDAKIECVLESGATMHRLLMTAMPRKDVKSSGLRLRNGAFAVRSTAVNFELPNKHTKRHYFLLGPHRGPRWDKGR